MLILGDVKYRAYSFMRNEPEKRMRSNHIVMDNFGQTR